MSDPNPVQNLVTLIKSYFEANGGRVVTLAELKALSPMERADIAGMILAQPRA